MATTPNYGWVTPAPTDFVVDLPADFETFADAVDADLAGLLGGTTNQVLKKTSNADHAFTWAVDPTTDVVTTAGDLIYGTAADTVTRLGIGTAGQVLAVNSGATAPEWLTLGVGMTLLASGNLASGTTSITSISGLYNDLMLVIRDFDPNTDNIFLYAQFNSDTGSNYWSSQGASNVASRTEIIISPATDNGANNGACVIRIFDYANTVSGKAAHGVGVADNPTTPTNKNIQQYVSFWNDASAITSIQLFPNGGTVDGGSYRLYGVK